MVLGKINGLESVGDYSGFLERKDFWIKVGYFSVLSKSKLEMF